MTSDPARRARVGRWAAAALACAALAAWPLPPTREQRAATARTFGEHLALRARAPVAEPDPIRPLLTAKRVGGHASSLLFGALVDDEVEVDAWVGPAPRALAADLAALGPDAAAVLLCCDEAGRAPGLVPALAAALGSPVVSGAAPGQSPLGHIGLAERAGLGRGAVLVSVWNLANDLGETELLRRLHSRLAPDGSIDALLAALRDPARAAAAQEAWFAARADAAREVVAVLGGAGFELERRARLHGARAVVVLLGLDGAADGSAPAPYTAEMSAALERALAARGVRVVALAGEGALRESSGELTEQGVERIVAAVRAALE